MPRVPRDFGCLEECQQWTSQANDVIFSRRLVGKLAILKDHPRAATIKVTSDHATILSMDRDTFKRLLGPLEHLMSSRFSMYSEEPKSQKPISGADKKAIANSDDEDDDVDELPYPRKGRWRHGDLLVQKFTDLGTRSLLCHQSIPKHLIRFYRNHSWLCLSRWMRWTKMWYYWLWRSVQADDRGSTSWCFHFGFPSCLGFTDFCGESAHLPGCCLGHGKLDKLDLSVIVS